MQNSKRRRQSAQTRRTRLDDVAVEKSDGKIERQSLLVLPALLIGVALIVTWAHFPALSAKAICFDDHQYLIRNNLVQQPSWASAKQFFTEVLAPSTVTGYYQPLTMISLMLDYAMGGRPDNLRPFHRTSLVLHVANTLLIILLLYLLFDQPMIAAMVGLLFGVHPLTVEPIPWIGERKTLLAAFFVLIALIAYVRYARDNGQWRSSAWYSVCFAGYVLALLAKPTSTPLPLCLLLLDFWPLQRLNRRTFLEKAPFFLIAAISSVITFVSQRSTAGVYYAGERSPLVIPLILSHNIIFYLYKIVWPAHLTAHYPIPNPINLSRPMVLAGVIGTCILIPLLVISLRRTRALLAGWLFFLIAIFPTMGVIGFTNVIASDKYAYLPAFGLLMVPAYFLGRHYSSRNNVLGGTRAIQVSIYAAAVLAVAASETYATRRYYEVWQDTDTLFQHMLTLAPDAPSLHYDLGYALGEKGRTDEAATHYRRALQLKPDYIDAYNNLGVILAAHGQSEEAIILYRKALELKPDDVKARNNLGVALVNQGTIDEAIGCYRRVLELDAKHAEAHYNLGIALGRKGQTPEAIVQFRQALDLKPDYVDALNNLGVALAGQGQIEQAVVQYRKALEMKPNHADAHSNLGVTLAGQGKIEEAIDHFHQALQLNPENSAAHYNLGNALARQGKTKEAVDHYRRALELKSDNAEAHNDLGVALAGQGQVAEAIQHYRSALRLKPDHAEAHNNLGVALSGQGQTAEAVEHYRQALELNHDHPPAHYNLANALVRLGHLDEAIAHYRRVLELKPDHIDSRNKLGLVLARQGRVDDAIAEYREVLRSDPRNEMAQRQLQSLSTQPAGTSVPAK